MDPKLCLDESSAWGVKTIKTLFYDPSQEIGPENASRKNLGFIHKLAPKGPLFGLNDSDASFICNAPDVLFAQTKTSKVCANGYARCDIHCTAFTGEQDAFNKQGDSLPRLMLLLILSYEEYGGKNGLFKALAKGADRLLIEAIQPRLRLTPICSSTEQSANCRPQYLRNASAANIYCAISSHSGRYLDMLVSVCLNLLLEVKHGNTFNRFHLMGALRAGSPQYVRLITVLNAPVTLKSKIALIEEVLQHMGEVALETRYHCKFQAYTPYTTLLNTNKCLGIDDDLCSDLFNGNTVRGEGKIAQLWK